jgi:hypothetical protein
MSEVDMGNLASRLREVDLEVARLKARERGWASRLGESDGKEAKMKGSKLEREKLKCQTSALPSSTLDAELALTN